MKSAVVALWATSMALITACIVLAVWHPDKVVATLTIVNVVVTTACTVVATWARGERR